MKQLTALAFSLLATAATAQFLKDGWSETGKLDLTLGGKRMALVTMIAPDGTPSAKVTDNGGFTTISLDAATISREGTPNLPFVSIVIGPYLGDRLPDEARFVMNLGDGEIVADGERHRQLKMSFPRLSGDKLTFSIAGEAYLGDGSQGAPIPFQVSGRYSGTVGRD